MSRGNRKRRQELGILPTPMKCTARTRDGSPCKNSPVQGSVVCRMHGGSAPQVLRKARERIAMATDDAASLLVRFMHDPDVPHAERRKAAEALLNRAGIAPGQRLEVALDAPWQEIIHGIVSEAGDESTELPARYRRPELEPTDVVEGEVIEEEPKVGDEIHVVDGADVYDYSSGRRVTARVRRSRRSP